MLQGQVRVLTLDLNVDGSRTLYRLQQSWTLQFRLGPSLLGRHVTLWTNCPLEDGASFDRFEYKQLTWESDSENKADETANYANILLKTSGAFHYFIKDEKDAKCSHGFFLVDPSLAFGTGEKLPMDSIQCMTYVTKNLGPFTGWEDKLRVAKESGYNMIHFTPLQVRGGSDSAYSLADQQELDPQYQCKWDDVEGLVKKMSDEWGVLSICDIVLNHAANESQWVHEHPECTFNCQNSPHLRPAFILDRLLYYMSLDIDDGLWVSKGLPKGEVSSQAQLDIAKGIIYDHYLPKAKIPELFQLNIEEILNEFELKAKDSPDTSNIPDGNLEIIQDPSFRRFKSTINFDLALKQFGHWTDRREGLKRKLEELNRQKFEEVTDHLNSGVCNALSGAQWERIAADGPHITQCNKKNPLSRCYFTGSEEAENLHDEEVMMYEDAGKYFMAHNGWVMGLDPTTNFADPKCNVYLRRELIAWGDSVKLNFGQKREDCPFLWDYMKKYVERTASIFHGIRLDNCHSTPIHVAEFLLDAARKLRPNLYVIAELFTGSEASDNQFMNRLGISSLIREALSAWDSHEEGRLVFRYGGEPVGAFSQPHLRPLIPSVAHAIFFDQTHDNPSSIEKRSVYDAISSTGLVSIACCASGSVRGYDELVPHHIHVVKEKRIYGSWGTDVNDQTGIINGKKALNGLHKFLGDSGFNEVYVDQMDSDTVAVTRHCPITHQSVVLVSYTAFSSNVDPNRRSNLTLQVEGELVQILLEARIIKTGDDPFEKDPTIINGLKNFKSEVREKIPIEKSNLSKLSCYSNDRKTIIDLYNLTPGSVIAFHFKLHKAEDAACATLRKMLTSEDKSLNEICNNLSLADLNTVLFRCDQEERDSNGGGVYVLDGHPLVYAGLQGVMSLLSKIRPINDLGNWLPSNLRNGNWLLDYISNRLKVDTGTVALGTWMDQIPFSVLKQIPRYLVPRYFDVIVTQVYLKMLERTWSLMSPFVQNGSFFLRSLALGSVQHGADIRSALLPPLSPNIEMNDRVKEKMVSLAAGLPHFSTGYMRNWGRDTFISLRGLFIITGRYEEARAIILSFGACLRHGLIPNLLDGGKNSRFNCRDAIWWWLHCIKSYVEEVPQGELILKDPVSRLYPTDDSPALPPGQVDQPLEDVIHEALSVHFQGLSFRERNAGKQIDEHMTDQGFNNHVGVDLNTGFVFGGNIYNCGTWMDKMGSSCRAGNKGKPATPRDGSAVELIGLSYSCLVWLASLHEKGLYSYGKVSRKNPDEEWTLQAWADKIRANFEKHFHVTKDNPNETRPDLVNKVNIYKDTLGSGFPWADYQLRCNFPIAMAVAPELFDPKNAWAALQIVKEKLLGPLGIATLDPDDWSYRGYYDNSNDSDDPSVANGFNYHQGPEWVWPVGYFLRAYLHFAKLIGDESVWSGAKKFVMAVMSAHFTEVQSSDWRGIPELTNKNGAFCPGSNPIQAWSMACLLEALLKIQE